MWILYVIIFHNVNILTQKALRQKLVCVADYLETLITVYCCLFHCVCSYIKMSSKEAHSLIYSFIHCVSPLIHSVMLFLYVLSLHGLQFCHSCPVVQPSAMTTPLNYTSHIQVNVAHDAI